MGNENVGEKIKQYRKQAGLSIRELSEAAGITSSMLCQIEKGVANPSINTLRSIAKNLDVAVFQFFLEEEDDEEIIVTPESRARITPANTDEKGVYYELLVPSMNGKMQFILMTIEPGAKSNREAVSHVGEEVVYVFEGKLTLYYKTRTYALQEGDSVRIPAQAKHLWKNESEDTAKIIFASSPSSF